jgi:hypothetical protein
MAYHGMSSAPSGLTSPADPGIDVAVGDRWFDALGRAIKRLPLSSAGC